MDLSKAYYYILNDLMIAKTSIILTSYLILSLIIFQDERCVATLIELLLVSSKILYLSLFCSNFQEETAHCLGPVFIVFFILVVLLTVLPFTTSSVITTRTTSLLRSLSAIYPVVLIRFKRTEYATRLLLLDVTKNRVIISKHVKKLNLI